MLRKPGRVIIGIDPDVFSRITADQVLSSTWDSMWYKRILLHGYSFNGNRSVQQNVHWPFLYPYLARLVGIVLRVPADNALILTNAIARRNVDQRLQKKLFDVERKRWFSILFSGMTASLFDLESGCFSRSRRVISLLRNALSI